MNYLYSRPHTQVMLEYEGETIGVDVAIAPLIQELWEAGIETLMCCQETEPGMA